MAAADAPEIGGCSPDKAAADVLPEAGSLVHATRY
jgi:hypothetical protein